MGVTPIENLIVVGLPLFRALNVIWGLEVVTKIVFQITGLPARMTPVGRASSCHATTHAISRNDGKNKTRKFSTRNPKPGTFFACPPNYFKNLSYIT